MEIVLHVPLPPLPLSRSPSRLECSSVSGSGSGPGLLLAHAGPTQTNRIFGHGSTRLCCLNKFGALIMLYTSSSSAGSHPSPPPTRLQCSLKLYLGFQAQGRISRAQRIDRPMARDRLSRDYVVWKMKERSRTEGGGQAGRERMCVCVCSAVGQ